MAEAQQKTEDNKVGALTSRDLQSLEGSFYDNSPTRGFEDFLVTLPDDPDFPFEIVHNLSPALPTGVRYEVLQSTYPVTLYHNPDDLWLPGVVTLRATSGGAQQIRIRLTVDDGDASPIRESNEGSGQWTSFPYRVMARGGFFSENWEVELDARGAYQDSSFLGVGLSMKVDPDNATSGYNWQILADTFVGGYHKRLLFVNPHSGDDAQFAMQLARDNSGTANTWYLTPNGDTGAGKLYLGGTDVGSAGGTANYITGIYTKGLTVSADTVTITGTRPAVRLTYSGTNRTGRIMMPTANHVSFTHNAYYDGSGWNLDDTGSIGSTLEFYNGGGWYFQTFTAGSNPRTAAEKFKIDLSGKPYERGRSTPMGAFNTSWTPGTTGTGSATTNLVTSGRYHRVGDTIFGHAYIQWTSTSVNGTGIWLLQAPATISTEYTSEAGLPLGTFKVFDNSTGAYFHGHVTCYSIYYMMLELDAAAGQVQCAASVPIAFADNDYIAITFQYRTSDT